MDEPKLVDAPADLRRVARSDDPLLPSELDRDIARILDKGNRFDVLSAGVLYFATQKIGAYAETLARFRPSARVRQAVADEDEDFLLAGTIPADWRERRRMATVTLKDALPFLDVEDPATHEYLTTAMAATLTGLDVTVLDVATVRGPNRLITRAMAAWAYDALGPDGEPRYSGIRYVSRLGDYECWALFDGYSLLKSDFAPIPVDDPDMMLLADLWKLHIR